MFKRILCSILGIPIIGLLYIIITVWYLTSSAAVFAVWALVGLAVEVIAFLVRGQGVANYALIAYCALTVLWVVWNSLDWGRPTEVL